MDGQQDGKDLTLKSKFTDGVNEGEVFELVGEVDGREILGDFSLGGHTGDCELERDLIKHSTLRGMDRMILATGDRTDDGCCGLACLLVSRLCIEIVPRSHVID